jgi:hypothetical protein
MGGNAAPKWPDEAILMGVKDDYHHTYEKNNAIIRWALARGCNHLFTCDVDTYVVVPRLLACEFEEHDYMGHRCDEGHAGGGYGYWLSRRAMEILRDDPPNGSAAYNDLGIGMKLLVHGIPVHHDPGFGDGFLTAHLGDSVNKVYDPQWMYQYHERFLESQKCAS